MEELKHGTEEMMQYVIIFENGKQMRLFACAEDWQDECMFMADVINYVDSEGICRYGSKEIKVTTC